LVSSCVNLLLRSPSGPPLLAAPPPVQNLFSGSAEHPYLPREFFHDLFFSALPKVLFFMSVALLTSVFCLPQGTHLFRGDGMHFSPFVSGSVCGFTLSHFAIRPSRALFFVVLIFLFCHQVSSSVWPRFLRVSL